MVKVKKIKIKGHIKKKFFGLKVKRIRPYFRSIPLK